MIFGPDDFSSGLNIDRVYPDSNRRRRNRETFRDSPKAIDRKVYQSGFDLSAAHIEQKVPVQFVSGECSVIGIFHCRQTKIGDDQPFRTLMLKKPS
jgi:hypothetical protein